MLKKSAHQLVAYPGVYNLVQYLAGARTVRQRIKVHITAINNPRRVLDLGGGTGMMRGIWPHTETYVCLDIDNHKLQGFRTRFPDDLAVRADGTAIPCMDASFNVVVLNFVVHHLDDQALLDAMHEVNRILKPGGSLVVTEPLWISDRWRGRVLWQYDQGSYPRTAETLEQTFSQLFRLQAVDRFAVHHAYACFWCIKDE